MAITGSNGAIVAKFTYDPWGMPTEFDPAGTAVTIGSWTASTGGTPGDGLFILFGGMLYDAAAGLYLTKTRAYNPKTGRFLQRDILDEDAKDGYDGFPFGKDAIGTNLYAWCNNNPVNRVDPSGLDSFGEWGRRVGGFVGGLFGRSDLGAAIGGYIGDRIDYAVGYAGISLGSNSGYNFSGYTAGNRARAKQAKPAPEKVLKSVSGKAGGSVGSMISRNMGGQYLNSEIALKYNNCVVLPSYADLSQYDSYGRRKSLPPYNEEYLQNEAACPRLGADLVGIGAGLISPSGTGMFINRAALTVNTTFDGYFYGIQQKNDEGGHFGFWSNFGITVVGVQPIPYVDTAANAINAPGHALGCLE